MDFMQSETRINLARAFAGESQARNRYTIYADIARKEGQEYLARFLEDTGQVFLPFLPGRNTWPVSSRKRQTTKRFMVRNSWR